MEDPVVIGQDIRDVNAKLRDHQKDWQDHQDKQRQCGSRGAEIRSELHAVHAECVSFLLELSAQLTHWQGASIE